MTNKFAMENLEELLKGWQGQFENPPAIDHLIFSQTKNGILMLDEKEICAADNLAPEHFSFDIESLSLGLKNGDFITIEILWSFDTDPVVSEIVHHHIIFKK